MEITPDAYILWQGGIFKINATIAVTWLIMLFLVTFSAVITRRLSSGEHLSRWQNLLEIIVSGIERQIKDAGIEPPLDFLPFLGTIFLFVAISNLLTVLPGYLPPTGSLSATAALAGSVFVAVPFWGIRQQGLAREQGDFMDRLKGLVSSEIIRILRMALKDITDEDLSKALVRVFTRRLDTLNDKDRARCAKMAQEEEIRVESPLTWKIPLKED